MFSKPAIVPSLTNELLGVLLFSGRTRSCHSAGAQHGIQKDLKPSGGGFSGILSLLHICGSFSTTPSCCDTCRPPLCSCLSLSTSLSSACAPLALLRLLLYIIDFLPPVAKCLFKILPTTNSCIDKRAKWFIEALPVCFAISFIPAGERAQDSPKPGGQCGGLQI